MCVFSSIRVYGSAQSVSTRVSYSSPTQLSDGCSFITCFSLTLLWSVQHCPGWATTTTPTSLALISVCAWLRLYWILLSSPTPTVNYLSLVVCQPTEIWGVLAEVPSEALGHSEWETKSERNDLFPVRQWDKAQSWEAKGFNQINVAFVISLSALSVCVSVCHLLSVCSAVDLFSVCHPSGCLTLCQSAWYVLPVKPHVSWDHYFCSNLKIFLVSAFYF